MKPQDFTKFYEAIAEANENQSTRRGQDSSSALVGSKELQLGQFSFRVDASKLSAGRHTRKAHHVLPSDLFQQYIEQNKRLMMMNQSQETPQEKQIAIAARQALDYRSGKLNSLNGGGNQQSHHKAIKSYH